jgi:succinate dehydrogenase/fumarate reductase cytochrome b subunit
MLMPEARNTKRFTNIHITDILRYRLPLSGIVSILHRVSGAMMFWLLPCAVIPKLPLTLKST